MSGIMELDYSPEIFRMEPGELVTDWSPQVPVRLPGAQEAAMDQASEPETPSQGYSCSFTLPPQVASRFQALCQASQQSQQQAVERLIRAYVIMNLARS